MSPKALVDAVVRRIVGEEYLVTAEDLEALRGPPGALEQLDRALAEVPGEPARHARERLAALRA